MRRIAGSAVVMMAVAVAALAAGPQQTVAGPVGVSAVRQDPGEALFRGKGNCFTCHKQDGTGTPLAPDLTDDEWLNFDDGRPTVEAVATLIREGVARPVQHPAPMPPMGGARLSDTEIEQLAAYVLRLSAE